MITEKSLDEMIKGPVTLIVNEQGQVIGNSQALARNLKGLAQIIGDFAIELDKLCTIMSEKMDKLE